MTDLLVAGEVTLDIYLPGTSPSGDEKVVVTATAAHPGGVGANTAVAAARAGAAVALVARVGDDPAGRSAVEGLAATGVEVDHIEVVDGASTLRCLLWRHSGGQRTSLLVADGLIFPSPAAVVAAVEGRAGWLHIAPFERDGVLAGVEAAGRGGVPVSLDLEAAGVEALGQALPSVLRSLALLVVGREVAAGLVGAATGPVLARQVGALGPGTVAVTGGASGVWVSVDGEAAVHVPAPAVEAVDGTGAGDCFTGTLLALLGQGAAVVEAARTAVEVAAASTTAVGAQSRPGLTTI